MKRPSMIMFDYGETLVHEESFNGVKGTQAVLDAAASNPDSVTARDIQDFADAINREIGRFSPDPSRQMAIEIHDRIFQRYLYEYFRIEFEISPEQIERIFENAATTGRATENISALLQFLQREGIRTGVISNMGFSGDMLNERIERYIPDSRFEFVIASSEYLFRKPNRRLFELALRKARLDPSEVWYCGDNPIFDIDGAAACGIFPVWYKGPFQMPEINKPHAECLVIHDWRELADYLKGFSR